MKNHIINLTYIIFEILPDIYSFGYQEKKISGKKANLGVFFYVLNEKFYSEIWRIVIFDLFVTFSQKRNFSFQYL